MRLLCEHCYTKPHSPDYFDKYSIKLNGQQLCRAVLNPAVVKSLPNKVGKILKKAFLPMIVQAAKKREEKSKPATMPPTFIKREDDMSNHATPELEIEPLNDDHVIQAKVDVTNTRNIALSDHNNVKNKKDINDQLDFSDDSEEDLSDHNNEPVEPAVTNNRYITEQDGAKWTLYNNKMDGFLENGKIGIIRKLSDLDKHLKHLEEELAKNGREISSLQMAAGVARRTEGRANMNDAGESDGSDGTGSWMIDLTGSGLLHFIQACLQEPKFKHIIRWTDKPENKQFEILDGHKFAEMWGREKKKEGMTKRKLNRSLSYLVKTKGKLIRCTTKKLRFTIVSSTKKATTLQKPTLPNADNVSLNSITKPSLNKDSNTNTTKDTTNFPNVFLKNGNNFPTPNIDISTGLLALLKKETSNGEFFTPRKRLSGDNTPYIMSPDNKRIKSLAHQYNSFLQAHNQQNSNSLELPLSNYMSNSNSPVSQNLSPSSSVCNYGFDASPYGAHNSPQNNATMETLNGVTIALQNSMSTDNFQSGMQISYTQPRSNDTLSNHSRDQSLSSPVSFDDMNNNVNTIQLGIPTNTRTDLSQAFQDLAAIDPAYFPGLDVHDSLLELY
ncbi:uncharacterized protein LOC130636584 [Hydractinia symbiolongicarpus]|uniref:uncharacterized protein LOC130636584 n=1 Tax=Hydractinia symbiolongicarpus TaxID=13093 RepID=UPI00254E5DDB|nr:uncharacterized protein LOC130636584 [Hydractinia symbiolongicarpus]